MIARTVVLSCLLVAASRADDIPLADRLERLRALVERDRVEHAIPGLALGVIHDGEVVLAEGFGTADLASGAPVTPDTVFAIGSSTKSFTAVLAAMLADEGLLDVDDAIAEHFEGVALLGGDEPTIRDALSHCTGLARMPLVSSCVDLSPDEVAGFASRAELGVPYRTAFSYSNVNYTLAGEAIARAADTTWHELVAARIFEPLGMDRSTTTLAARDAMDDVAEGYELLDEDTGEHEFSMDWDLSAIAPAGAINASLTDMLTWAEMLVEEGRSGDTTLVSEEGLEDLWRMHVPTGGYGTGFFVGERLDVRVVHHGGNVPGFATQVALMPDHDAAVVLLSNTMIHPLQETVIADTVACLFGDALPPLDGEVRAYPSDLERYAGRYWFAQGRTHMTALVEDDALHLDVPGQTVYELLPPDDDGKWTFAMTDTIAVSFADGDPAPSMTMYQAGMELPMPREERRAPDDAPALDTLLGEPVTGGLLVVGEWRFPNQGVFADTSIEIGIGSRVRDDTDLGRLGLMSTVIDGGHGWSRDVTGTVHDLDDGALTAFLAQYLGVFAGRWREVYDTFEIVDRRDVDGTSGFVVEARRGDGRPDELVFAADGRLLALHTTLDGGAMGGIGLDTTYADWRDVGGRSVPFRARSTMFGVGRVEADIALVKTDHAADEQRFAPLEERVDAR